MAARLTILDDSPGTLPVVKVERGKDECSKQSGRAVDVGNGYRGRAGWKGQDELAQNPGSKKGGQADNF